jgi:hypothetical protein
MCEMWKHHKVKLSYHVPWRMSMSLELKCHIFILSQANIEPMQWYMSIGIVMDNPPQVYVHMKRSVPNKSIPMKYHQSIWFVKMSHAISDMYSLFFPHESHGVSMAIHQLHLNHHVLFLCIMDTICLQVVISYICIGSRNCLLKH